MNTFCLDCNTLIKWGNRRCTPCQSRYNKVVDRRKNSNKQRKLYLDPAYRSMIPSGKCYYCDSKADTKEHLIPIAQNGTNDKRNIVFACRSCNSKKGGGVRKSSK